jgi:isopentenyl phosphate kinase
MNSPTQSSSTVFLKLGGSLITDKHQPYTARHGVIGRLADETRQALDQNPHLRLLIGHGSGSFGHWAAKPYGTREGVHSPAQWRGYAQVSASASRLNRIVTDAFLGANVPVLSIQPSASAQCHAYSLQSLSTEPIRGALAQRLVPLLYGDVAFDDVHGGTIISTEDIFVFLAEDQDLRPSRILLLGEMPGVLDAAGDLVPRITPDTLPAFQSVLNGSSGVDVTGGMADKVTRMVELVRAFPDIKVHLFSGTAPGTLARVLANSMVDVGTRIESGISRRVER